MCNTHERLNFSEFLTLLFAVFNRTHKMFTQCMIQNEMFSIVTRHKITIFDVDIRNGSNYLFKVQLKMAFAVEFLIVMSHSRCQKSSAITKFQFI